MKYYDFVSYGWCHIRGRPARLVSNAFLYTTMVSTRKKRQTNRKLLSQSDDFNQDTIICNAAGERQENIAVNERTIDRVFNVGTSGNNSAINENTVNVNFGKVFY